MQDFVKATRFLLLDLASTIFFLILFLLTHNAILSVALGTALGGILIATQLVRGSPVHVMEWLSLFLVLAAGVATILTDDPRFVLFKPSVIYAVTGAVMLKAGWMLRYMPPIARSVAPDSVVIVGYGWAALMFATAAVNALVAMSCSVEAWAAIMLTFGILSKAVVFIAGFLAVRLITVRRVRTMPAGDREALLASTGLRAPPSLQAKPA